MVALLYFLLTLFASPLKSKSRLEAENAVLRHQLTMLRRKARGDLMADWKYLDERIEGVTDEIEALAHADEGCQQLITEANVDG